MTTAPTQEQRPPPQVRDISAQTAETLVALARQARALRRPTRYCAVTAISAALISWIFPFAGSVFISFTSALACLVFLVLLLLPGTFLVWVYRSLGEVSKLPGRFHLPSELPTATPPSTPKPQAGGSLVATWKERLRQRATAVFDVWTLLEYIDEIKSLGGPSRFLAFLTTPISKAAFGIALGATAFLVILALFTLLRALLGAAF